MNPLYTINFNEIYKESSDPWFIGNANSDRFNEYLSLFDSYNTRNKICIDIGCGNGVFTKRLSKYVAEIHGIDISKNAINIAKNISKAKNIHYHICAASSINKIGLKFDLLFCSDLLYYMNPKERKTFFLSIRQCLNTNALCFFSAWCPGGDYFNEQEFCDLICENLTVNDFFKIPSDFVNKGRYIMIIGKFK